MQAHGKERSAVGGAYLCDVGMKGLILNFKLPEKNPLPTEQ